MSKKEIKKEEGSGIGHEIKVQKDPNRLYSIEDKVEILRLAKVANASQVDMDSIYSLYKKYINDKAGMYRTNCNCSNSISKYWSTLLQFYSDNGGKFESE
jgi:hypothetical protein